MKLPIPPHLLKFLDKHSRKKNNTYYVSVRCYFFSCISGTHIDNYFGNKEQYPIVDVFLIKGTKESAYVFYRYLDIAFRNELVKVVSQIMLEEGKTQYEAMLDFCEFYDFSEEDISTETLRKIYYRFSRKQQSKI